MPMSLGQTYATMLFLSTSSAVRQYVEGTAALPGFPAKGTPPANPQELVTRLRDALYTHGVAYADFDDTNRNGAGDLTRLFDRDGTNNVTVNRDEIALDALALGYAPGGPCPGLGTSQSIFQGIAEAIP